MRAPPKAVIATCAVAIATLAGGYAAAVVGIPLVHMPEPSGAWRVGTVTATLLPESPSSVVAKLWYPAPADAWGRPAPYLETTAGKSLRFRLVSRLVAPSAIESAPVASGRLPVVISLPGWGGSRESNSAQAENLASHGYVVVAVDDFSLEPAMDFSSTATLERSIAAANRKLDTQTRNVERLLDGLHVLNATRNGRFFERLDFERIGLLGFSFGGAVAAETVRRDARFKAAVDLDGWLFGEALREGVPGPFLVVSTGSDAAPVRARGAPGTSKILAGFDRRNGEQILAGLDRHAGYYVTIEGTEHYNFTDAAWLPTLRRTGLGPIDGRHGWRIVATAVQQFFDHSLKGAPAPFFAPDARLDDVVRVRAFRGRQFVSALR